MDKREKDGVGVVVRMSPERASLGDSSLLAKLQVAVEEMPLSQKDRDCVVHWLRQVADEIDRGEHFDCYLWTLGKDRHAKG